MSPRRKIALPQHLSISNLLWFWLKSLLVNCDLIIRRIHHMWHFPHNFSTMIIGISRQVVLTLFLSLSLHRPAANTDMNFAKIFAILATGKSSNSLNIYAGCIKIEGFWLTGKDFCDPPPSYFLKTRFDETQIILLLLSSVGSVTCTSYRP